jgi:hypothetical protein
MSPNLKAIGVAALFALPALLVGCRSGYEVDIRNLTDQPVSARIVTPFGDGANTTLAQKRLGPGDRGSLFRQTDSNQRVALEVDFAGNVGFPATIDLSPGKTVVNVRRTDEGTHGHVRLEEIPRP